MYYPEGWTVYASQAVKKAVSIPVINSHTFRNPDYCDQLVANGDTDMIGLARQLLCDPYWPMKAYMGKPEQIRRCISCLTGCWQESMMAKKEIGCAINPACGHMEFDDLKPAAAPLKVGIVGGGPAGMEAARIATVRGHRVTLFEKTGELGGAILGCCMAPGKEKMKWYADWIRGQIKDLNVDMRLHTSPTVEQLKEFDVVLNATGAVSYVPECIGAERVVPFEEAIACPKVTCPFHPKDRKMRKTGEKVLVWGDHYAAADTAAALAGMGKDVTIVTDKKEFGASVEVIHMYVLRKRFAQTDAEALHSEPFKYPVKVYENSTVYSIEEGKVVLMDKNFQRTELAIDDVITCNTRSNTALFDELMAAGVPVVNAGDSKAPRNLHAAVMEGATFGLKLEESVLMNPNHSVVDDLPADVRGQLLR